MFCPWLGAQRFWHLVRSPARNPDRDDWFGISSESHRFVELVGIVNHKGASLCCISFMLTISRIGEKFLEWSDEDPSLEVKSETQQL